MMHLLLNDFFNSRMAENRGLMYGGWEKGGAHMREIYQLCILFTKQLWFEVPMQQM
jgi:hypothetical protein